MDTQEIIGNSSTIIKIFLLTTVPAELLRQYNVDQLSVSIAMILLFIFSLVDAKYPNKIRWLNKIMGGEETPIEETLNDEYEY